MNLSNTLRAPTRLLYRIGMKGRSFFPKQECQAFGFSTANGLQGVEKVYVINLDRQTDRWREMVRELRHVIDTSGAELVNLVERYPAVDARAFARQPPGNKDVNPFYTLGDQLYVEPQPHALPDRLELNRPIRMSRPEIAVALSHIGVWRRIAAGEQSYALVLEDDTYFQRGFGRYLDQAWREINADEESGTPFDILYLSYMEVKHGAQKTLLSGSLFQPVRGLWFLSGYVLSREGAGKLLRLLPCRGPVDLWINHQFGALNVLATRRSIVAQRWDTSSTNLYSVLPALTKIGVMDSGCAALFHIRPSEKPVFAFGLAGSGLTSLAMALSMLGYRCCSDLQELPESELVLLLSGSTHRVFDAYVNIGSLTGRIAELRKRFPRAKFIVTSDGGTAGDTSLDNMGAIDGLEVAVLRSDQANKWQVICEHLRCAPPVCPYPEIADLGQRRVLAQSIGSKSVPGGCNSKHDKSPWVVESRQKWRGIYTVPSGQVLPQSGTRVELHDSLAEIDDSRWLLRDDTFAGNLALFRASNVESRAGVGAALNVRSEPLGVRSYSAASISSRDRYLFGRFEAVIQASNVSGVITGFFLHRDSPRQEIDIEIVGNRPDHLLVNVFYNPGEEGVKYDYGYRGAPSHVALGFDASKSAHRFAIEWGPSEIRWLVDDQPVHRRVNWDPTPIPQLPMTLHVNTWPSRSKELAGRLNNRLLPATTVVRSISVDATLAAISGLHKPNFRSCYVA